MALGKELVDLDQAFDKRLHLIYFFPSACNSLNM